MRLAAIVTLSFLTVVLHGQQTLHVPAQYATIQSAVSAAVTGDTVLVAPGTYSGHVTIIGKSISLIGSAGSDATFIDNNATGYICLIAEVPQYGNPISVTGFSFIGGATGALQAIGPFALNDCRFDGIGAPNSLINLNSAGGVCSVTNCEIQNCWAASSILRYESGGSVTATLSNIHILGCVAGLAMLNLGPGSGSLSATDVELSANTSTFSASVSGSAPIALDRWRVAENTCYAAVDLSRQAAVGAGPLVISDWFVHSNVTDPAFAAVQWSGSILIRRSTIASDFGPALRVASNSSPSSLAVAAESSIFYSANGSPVASQISFYAPLSASNCAFSSLPIGLSSLVTNIVGPIRFVDPSNGDYHLAWNSPCRDAGDPNATNLPTTDLDGTPRVVGAAIDIGCDEIPAQQFPGTGEDLDIYVKVNEQGDPLASSTSAGPGDVVHVLVRTPGGTFVGSTFALAGEFGPIGYTPFFDPLFPYVHLYPNQAFLLAGTMSPAPFAGPGLPPSGLDLYYQIPPGLSSYTIRLQGFAITAFSANGIFACSNARDLVF